MTAQLIKIGDFIEAEGGYFFGVVVIDGQQYGNVVAPKAVGELTGEWGEYGKKIDARHFADGLANTEAMAAAGSELAAKVLALSINGKDDWHIPARDQLELAYRHLKPTDEKNACFFRDGENPSSVPVGGLYEEDSPAQTSVEAFQKGGAEAFEDIWYWSSSQSSAYYAFIQWFADGFQSYYYKYYQGRVRAVRRFLIDSSLYQFEQAA